MQPLASKLTKLQLTAEKLKSYPKEPFVHRKFLYSSINFNYINAIICGRWQWLTAFGQDFNILTFKKPKASNLVAISKKVEYNTNQ